MNARRCQGCAAPLPESETGATLRCRFCGLIHDPATGSPVVHVQQIRVAPAASTRSVRWLIAIVVLSLIAALVPVVFGLYVGWRAFNAAPTAVVPTSPVRRTALAPAQLRGAASGNHALDAAPPGGGYGAIDPVHATPWALAIAQAWAPDAVEARAGCPRAAVVHGPPSTVHRHRRHALRVSREPPNLP